MSTHKVNALMEECRKLVTPGKQIDAKPYHYDDEIGSNKVADDSSVNYEFLK